MNGKLACLCCGTEFPLGALRKTLRDRRKGLSGIWQIVECDNCGIWAITPSPTDTDLAKYYAAYTPDSRLDVQNGLGSRYPMFRKLFHYLSGDVDPRDFVVIPQGARVLDYGSGEGTYLRYFHDRGVDIYGAEITDTLVAAARKRGLNVKKVDSFDAIPFSDAEFEVVYLMQVFEHLRDPRSFMKELSRILKQGGALYLAVPNAASAWRRVFGLNWVSGYFAPFHLAHYTEAALARLGSESGLKPVGSWSRTPDSWLRLNLRAAMYPAENSLDSKVTWIDRAPIRHAVTAVLRLCELILRERDCLVMKFERQ
jgi:SAM-dependent methyltransferase